MVLAAKAALGFACLLLVLILAPGNTLMRLDRRKFNWTALLMLALSRGAVFIALFVFGHAEAQSDVTVYYTEASQALHGQLPFIDIHTAYGPLFPYVAAGPLLIWNSAKAIILFSILTELISLPIWMAAGRAVFSELTTRRAALLYVANPVAISTVAIAGQNHVWLAMLFAAAILAIYRNRDGLSGFWIALSIVAVKFLSLVFAPAMFLAARRRTIWTICFASLPVIAYGCLLWRGVDLTAQVKFHASYNSSGNLPYLLSALGMTFEEGHARTIANLVGMAALGASFFAALWRFGLPRGRVLMLLSAFLFVVVLIVNKKAFTSYLIIVLFPLCLSVAQRRAWLIAATVMTVLSALAALEPSLWYRWLEQRDLSLLWQSALPSNITRTHVLMFLVCELILIAWYFGMLRMLWVSMTEAVAAKDLSGETSSLPASSV